MAADPAAPRDPEQLLGHDAFVRGLAHQLIRDPERAEDVAQQAWLAALQRPPAGSSGPTVRAFFASIVRRLIGRTRRGERRELARQQLVARESLVPSTADILAREAQRASVVRTVLALEPVYRDVVVLRFFEQLPPRAIAARLAVPVETVRTRLKRALAMLRERLDAECGGRAAWIGLLLPYGKTAAAPVAALVAAKTFLLGVLSMSLQKLVVVAVALVLVASAWIVMSPPSGALDPAAKPRVEAAAPSTAELAAKVVADAATAPAAVEPTAGQRTAVVVPDVDATGSLLVKVVFADGSAAPDVLVQLEPRGGDEMFDARLTLSDASGSVHFKQLPAGRYSAQPQRGGLDSSKSVEVVAGREAELQLALDIGMDVHGIVVDKDEHPLAGAEVVVAGWTGQDTHTLATTAADGTFAMRAVATHCHIGARAKGYAASAVRQFTAGKGASVEMHIVLDQVGAELAGVVVDSRQRPIAGAVVRVGDPEQRMTTLPDGGSGMAWRAVFVRTDAMGEFVVASLPAGKVPVAVRARGFGAAQQEVEVVAGRREPVRITLVAAASVVGTVHAADGKPVAEVRIEAGDWNDFGHVVKASGADGAFRLDGLTPGELALHAESPKFGKAKTTLTLVPGQVVQWDPVLVLGATQRGRVIDDRGDPVEGAMIEAQVLGGGRDDFWWGNANTAADGRFEFHDCPVDRALRVEVKRKSSFPEWLRDDVRWSADDLVITLPKAAFGFIAGTILDPAGKPLPNVAVSPYLKRGSSSPAETADPATGAFKLGPYPPAEYELRIAAAGFVPMRLSHTLLPDETWDLGELRFERGGYVVVSPVADDAQRIADAHFEVLDAEGKSHSFESQHGRLRAGPIRAGSCQLRAWGERIAAIRMAIVVSDGQETVVDVPLQRGVIANLSATAPTPAAPKSTIVEFTIRNAAGELLGKPAAYLEGNTASVKFALAPGHYTVEATAEGLRGRGELDVASDRAEVTVSITMQPE